MRIIIADIAAAASFGAEIRGCSVIFSLAGEVSHIHSMRDPARVSDATPEIAEQQARSFEQLGEHAKARVLTLDTARALDIQIDEIARAVDDSIPR